MWKSANRWVEDENEVIEQMADVLDDVAPHPSRLVKLIHYIETELFNKKIVVFTDQIETFNIYYEVLNDAISAVRCNAALDSSWKKRIDKDYKKRGQHSRVD